MIDRLIPRYPAFLVIGLIIVATGVLLLMSSRDALIAVWANKFFDGEIDGLFEASQTADLALGHTLSIWPFLGLGFLMLGIGFAIATIVQNLRATGRSILDAYASAGLPEADALRTTEPWFGRVFTRFLFAGILVMGTFFLLMLWWDGNLVLLEDAEFDGRTSGFAYNSYLMIERVLGALIGAGKFLSLGLLIFGILTGLVTIIWHLSFQARVLPGLTRRALVGGDANDGAEPPGPFIPGALLKLGIAGFSIIALAMLLAFIQAGFIGWDLGRQFEGSISEMAMRVEGTFGRSITPLILMGMGTLFFTIALLLLNAIRWLREQRRGFGDLVAEVSDGAIARPTVEESLWPARMVTPLAILGIFVVGYFFFTMTGVHGFNFNNLLTLQFAGVTGGSLFENTMRLDRILAPIIGATRFVGIAFLMVAIGLALVAIAVNLRATVLLLPTGFSKLIPVAQGQKPEADDLSVYEPMSLAPWELFRPLMLGAVVVISATLPIAILLGVSIQRMLEEQFAGQGIPGAGSDSFESWFLAANLLGASWQPWMLFGMGLILFAIGSFFTTIVGFVQARRMIIAEGAETIAGAVAQREGPTVQG